MSGGLGSYIHFWDKVVLYCNPLRDRLLAWKTQGVPINDIFHVDVKVSGIYSVFCFESFQGEVQPNRLPDQFVGFVRAEV